MKLSTSTVNYKKTAFLIVIILAATVAVAAGRKLFFGADDVQIEKFCDAAIKYCVKQTCKIPFRSLKSAVLSAYSFFGKLGYTGRYFVDIDLIPEVSVVWGESDGKIRIRVLGKYEEGEKRIYLTCWGDKWLSGGNDFKLHMTPELYETIVAHEMIHFLANRYANDKINVILSEYVAYSGQLELFAEETIRMLVERHKVTAFEENDINEDALQIDPAVFALKSYLHYKHTKGSLVKEIIAGTFKEPRRIWPPH